MDTEIKETVSAKLSKKELANVIEIKIVSAVSELTDGNKASNQLDKRIKKASKLISEKLHGLLKEKEEKTDQVKKKKKNVKKRIKKVKS